jgi:hypothetical protein
MGGTVVRARTLDTFAPMRGLPLSKLNPRGPIRMRSTSDSLMANLPCEESALFSRARRVDARDEDLPATTDAVRDRSRVGRETTRRAMCAGAASRARPTSASERYFWNGPTSNNNGNAPVGWTRTILDAGRKNVTPRTLRRERLSPLDRLSPLSSRAWTNTRTDTRANHLTLHRSTRLVFSTRVRFAPIRSTRRLQPHPHGTWGETPPPVVPLTSEAFRASRARGARR